MCRSGRQACWGAFDINSTDASRPQPVLQLLAQCHVFMQQVGVVFLGEPARFPALVVAQSKSVRMCFLPQNSLLLLLRFLRALLDCLASLPHGALHAL